MMPAPRAVLVDGPPGTGRTRLVQELALQCEAAGLAHEWWPATRGGHPLMRSFEPAVYPGLEAYGSVLEVQWHNFAIRAGTTKQLYLFDGALLQAGFRTLLAAGAAAEAVADMAVRLLAALQDLEPTVLYLSRREAPADADSGWGPWRDCCDGVFAGLSQHRLLINASRSDARQRLQDALDFLDLRHRSLTADAGLIGRLVGRYGSGDDQIRIDLGNGLDSPEPTIALPGRPGMRSLLAGSDGSFLVAGSDLKIQPREQAGAISGLLLETGDPHFASLPTWLPRSED
ncbi:MAG: hypothetical protein JJT88_14910 [Gammaproteobacteria bacterium]|nr:hypothetical protein [Gammaproteobacteria bacterium]